jgi:flagella basal body P-ring formation protein FlgA
VSFVKRLLLKISLLSLLFCSGAFAKTVITAAEIKNAVEEFVVSQIETDLPLAAIAVVDVRWQNDIEVAADVKPVIRVRKSSSRKLRGPSVVRVGIDLDGETLRKMSITADVRIHMPVLVAAYNLKRGEQIESTFFEITKSDVTKLRGVYYTDQNELKDLRMVRSLSAGDVLTDQHIERIPIIKRGEFIRILARGDLFEVTTEGTAMQDGGKGDLIRVKNVDSGKVIRGHVIDSGLIEVGL